MNAHIVAEARRLHKLMGPHGLLKDAVAQARKNMWHPHRSKGAYTKYGGPCVSKVNWNAF